MMKSRPLRILLLAPGANPEIITGGIIGYSLAEALARSHQVTLVARSRDVEAIRRGGGKFHSIESFASPRLDRAYDWIFRRVFKEDRGNVLWTAARYPIPVIFEWRVWRRVRTRLQKGEFDVVLRILEIVPEMPSALAFLIQKGSTPFVIGPLNGGVPWPKGFSQLRRQRAAAGNWAASLRGFYRYLPFGWSTYSRAKAIIVGSSHTYAEFTRFRDKLFYVPGENGIRLSQVEDRPSSEATSGGPLDLVYVGRLVPYKACDLALHGAARLLRSGRAHMTILGDGPERPRLEMLAGDLQVRSQVTFFGWAAHSAVLARLRKADVLLFPSLREFGGGVVFEALANGAVPVVADHGGPGDIVRGDVGYRIRVTNEHQMVEDIGSVLEHLAADRIHLEALRRRGIAYAREALTWERKAQMITDILLWATGAGSKPSFPPPKTL